MSMVPYFVIWACVAVAAITVALYRRMLARKEDDFIHLGEAEGQLIPQQVALAERLAVIERWEKILVIVAAVGGFLLLAAYGYVLWLESQKPVGL